MEALSIAVLLVYIVILAIAWLIAMIPMVINAVGLARICQKLGAFMPVWCWVWALLFPPVALLRAGDLAADKENPYYSRKHFRSGIIAFILCCVLTVLAMICSFVLGFSSEIPSLSALTIIAIVAVILFTLALFAASIWMTVLLYISYFRIFKLYVPTWGAWLMFAGMILLSQFSFLLLPILSFLPMKE